MARVESVNGPTEIGRRDRQRVVFVTAGLAGRPLSEVVQHLQRGLAAVPVPAGYSVRMGGDVEAQEDSFAQIFQALGLSALLM